MPPKDPQRGQLKGHTRWCGQVDVAGNILVPRGAILTVDPGTVVRFRAYQGYEAPERNLRLRVEGRILANGRPGEKA